MLVSLLVLLLVQPRRELDNTQRSQRAAAKPHKLMVMDTHKVDNLGG